MGEKSRANLNHLYSILLLVVVCLLIYTRFNHLSWGLPYPFHPDERNMADAIMKLSCTQLDLECFNPHFFAYGQLPLYLGYLGISIYHFVTGLKTPVNFEEAVLSLRTISAFSSVLMVLIMIKLVQDIYNGVLYAQGKKIVNDYRNKFKDILILLICGAVFIFSPALIQFAHFGTTESLLMFFLTLVTYFSIKFSRDELSFSRYIVLSGTVCGLALATKVSAFSYLIIPASIIFYHYKPYTNYKASVLTFFTVFQFLTLSLLIGVVFSPYNFIDFNGFLGSMQYESSVGLGKVLVFYTRQFQLTLPVIFQLSSIFPYALGSLVFGFFCGGVILLPYKKEFNILRLSFIVYFLLNVFLYTKWTRFMAPVFPVMEVMSVLFLLYLYEHLSFLLRLENKPKKKVQNLLYLLVAGFVFLSLLPGVAYLSVYLNPDVRFRASEWIYQNIPPNSVLLSETANVVNLPIPPPYPIKENTNSYEVIPFNSYELDESPQLKLEFTEDLKKADYIVVPSRRVFANHTCIVEGLSSILLNSFRCDYLKKQYPLLNEYYDRLFTGKLGFGLVKEFNSDPYISLLGKKIISFKDEHAEETWSVFDHPTIRIYKRIP